MEDIVMNAGLCAAAYAYHFMEYWAEERKTTKDLSIAGFCKMYPAKNGASLLGTIVAFVGCYAVGWLNPLGAVACGYMGDSVVRRLVGKFNGG